MTQEEVWYKLDTAAKVYPAILSQKQPNVFRLSCTLKEPVDPVILQTALDVAITRFPVFNVRLKRGAFWFYFEENQNRPLIVPETGSPCQWIDPTKDSGFLFRVSWFRNRITLEIYHVMTDATGGMEFLKSLVYYYLFLSGKPVSPDGKILTLATKPDEEELENSFERWYDPAVMTGRGEERAFHASGTLLPIGKLRVIQGIIPACELLKRSRLLGVTLTEYLTAALVKAYFRAFPNIDDQNQIVKISVPINLRKIFPSHTLRNFSFYTNVGDRFINKDEPFETLVQKIRAHMKREVTQERILPRMNPNVNAEKNLLLRVAPLDMKQKVIKVVHKLVGEDLFTCSMSNFGVVILPESMEPYVSHFDFILSSSDRIGTNCAICSYKNELVISFSSVMQQREIEKAFFRFLAADNVPVRLVTTEN